MAKLPDPFPSLLARIKRLEDLVNRIINGSAFSGTPLRPQADGSMLVDAALVVSTGEVKSGDFETGVSGWHLGADGNAEFNDVTLRGILVGLDTPVQQKTYKSPASGFSLTVPWDEKAGQNITVPAGCTRASVDIKGRMYAINPNTSGGADTTGTDALYITIGIDGQFSTATATGVSGSNGYATTIALDAFDLTGLTPGSTIRLSVQGSSGYQSIAANPDNYIVGIASITWMR